MPLLQCKFNETPFEDEENSVGRRWLQCGVLNIEKAWEVEWASEREDESAGKALTLCYASQNAIKQRLMASHCWHIR